MIPFRIRKRLLTKLAQSVNIPTEEKVNEKPNIGTPPNFSASSKYPGLRKGFSPNAITIVDNLSSYMNKALFYASDGQYNMTKLSSNNFNFSPTMIPSTNRDLKNLLLFSKEIYSHIYNSGNNYESLLNAKDYKFKINTLLQSQNLTSLAQTNPTGQLAMKMGGNIKTDIINLLNSLISISPTE